MVHSEGRWSRVLLRTYVGLFFVYMFLPLALMSAAAFNASPYPSVTRWQGFTFAWFGALTEDRRLIHGLVNSLVVGAAVIVLALPLGLAAALLIHRIRNRWSNLLYAVLVSPILMPGIFVGLSTVVFWRNFDVAGGLFTAILAQVSFIASYALMIFLARLERFDTSLEEAALDLGASKPFYVRRVLFPYLRSAALTAGTVAFIQSFENYNTTVFSIGGDWTLTTEVGSRLRFGLTPVINVLGVIFVVVTVVCATLYVLLRRKAPD